MALTIICQNKDPKPWVEELLQKDPSLDIRVWPNDGDRNEIVGALTWMHPEGVLQDYPNLKWASSMGAGVDQFLNDAKVPTQINITRLVTDQLAESMFEYVQTAVLYFFRQFDAYCDDQTRKMWQPLPAPSKRDLMIGIMGLGKLGKHLAEQFANDGFQVVGWARSQKTIHNVTCYDQKSLPEFLAKTNMLVCMLPLTEDTENILNADLFAQLPEGAHVINVARGAHLVEQDLIDALDSKQLSGACLDVFRKEPLPKDHPFWSNQNVLITPHISSQTDPREVIPQILENYDRLQKGAKLLNLVDLERGY